MAEMKVQVPKVRAEREVTSGECGTGDEGVEGKGRGREGSIL